MDCPYCRASNAEDDHRCRRCGRRLGNEGVRSTPNRFQHSATAPALSFEPEKPESDSVLRPQPGTPRDQPRKPVYQPSLFGSREMPRVVSFEAFAPESVQTEPKKPARPRAKHKPSAPGQQSFGFDAAPAYQPATGQVEPTIPCDAAVALPAHRMIAVAFDACLVLAAVFLFAGVFLLAAGQSVVSKHALPLLIGMTAASYLFYEILWCLADTDTAGMRWAQLKLVNFDGQAPGREQRFFRLAAACLGLLAAGLGLIWALVDEESLTWHDHISKTFPTIC